MLRPVRVALALLFLTLGLACAGLGELDLSGKPPPSPEWVGRWEGPGMVVVIGPDGMIGVSHHTEHTNTDLNAPAQAWTDDGVDVGLGGFVTHYRIDERPYEKDGVWRMVVEGVPLERVSGGEPMAVPAEPTAPGETDAGGAAAPTEAAPSEIVPVLEPPAVEPAPAPTEGAP